MEIDALMDGTVDKQSMNVGFSFHATELEEAGAFIGDECPTDGRWLEGAESNGDIMWMCVDSITSL